MFDWLVFSKKKREKEVTAGLKSYFHGQTWITHMHLYYNNFFGFIVIFNYIYLETIDLFYHDSENVMKCSD